jgi:pyruvate dehydrogenase E2 component (dihydrolipoamide acetyltransferase)
MATEVLIPKLGMTMTEGTVAEWHVVDGAEVKPGDPVYRLETEKIEFEVEAEAAGIVRHAVPAGTKMEPGAIAGYILAAGEAMPEVASVPVAAATAGSPQAAQAAPAAAPLEGGRIAASPAARRLAQEAGIDLAGVAGSGPDGRITEADVVAARSAPAATPAGAGAPAGDVIASPVARRLAQTLGIDVARVPGTGPGGRITKEDVEAAVEAGIAAPAPAAAGGPARQAGEVIPMRGMRKVIAERMHGSLQGMAQLTMEMDVGMDAAVGLRTRLVKEWEAEDVRPTYTDLIIKAVAKALTLHPLVNATVTEAGIELLGEVHVGMAVALEEGLVVPVIRDADRLTLREIAAESSRLASAARAKSLGMDEMTGGTFSVTSLGMADIDFFTPIINPPNVAILGVGRIRDDVAWEGSTPRRTKRMTLSLTIDHRAVDGAPGAAFLGTVRDLLQAPFRLLS